MNLLTLQHSWGIEHIQILKKAHACVLAFCLYLVLQLARVVLAQLAPAPEGTEQHSETEVIIVSSRTLNSFVLECTGRASWADHWFALAQFASDQC